MTKYEKYSMAFIITGLLVTVFSFGIIIWNIIAGGLFCGLLTALLFAGYSLISGICIILMALEIRKW